MSDLLHLSDSVWSQDIMLQKYEWVHYSLLIIKIDASLAYIVITVGILHCCLGSFGIYKVHKQQRQRGIMVAMAALLCYEYLKSWTLYENCSLCWMLAQLRGSFFVMVDYDAKRQLIIVCNFVGAARELYIWWYLYEAGILFSQFFLGFLCFSYTYNWYKILKDCSKLQI